MYETATDVDGPKKEEIESIINALKNNKNQRRDAVPYENIKHDREIPKEKDIRSN